MIGFQVQIIIPQIHVQHSWFQLQPGVRMPITENNAMLLRLGYNTTFPFEEGGGSYLYGLIGLSFSNRKTPANIEQRIGSKIRNLRRRWL